MPGSETTTSMTRETARSTRPPRYPAVAPMTVPAVSASTAAVTESEIRAP